MPIFCVNFFSFPWIAHNLESWKTKKIHSPDQFFPSIKAVNPMHQVHSTPRPGEPYKVGHTMFLFGLKELVRYFRPFFAGAPSLESALSDFHLCSPTPLEPLVKVRMVTIQILSSRQKRQAGQTLGFDEPHEAAPRSCSPWFDTSGD